MLLIFALMLPGVWEVIILSYACRYQEAQKRKERLEAHLYANINVILEDEFVGHQGHDLFDPEKCHVKTFKEKKTSTVRQMLQTLADGVVSESKLLIG